MTVSCRPAFVSAAFLHFRLHLRSLQKTPFTTSPATASTFSIYLPSVVYLAPSPLHHSSTIHFNHNPQTYFRVKYLTPPSCITLALTTSLFSTPKLPLQEIVIHVHYNAMPYSLESLLKRIDARWDIRENTRHMDHYMNGMLIHAKYDIKQLTVVASHLKRFSRRTAEEWDAIPKFFMDDSSHGKVSNEIILC